MIQSAREWSVMNGAHGVGIYWDDEARATDTFFCAVASLLTDESY